MYFLGKMEVCRTSRKANWLGCQDSNLGMAESKSAALPLGYTPAVLEVTGLYECFEWGSRVNTSIRRAGRNPVSVYVRVTKLGLFGSRSKREREADQKQDPEHDGLELRRWDMPSRPASKLDPKQRWRDCQNGQAEIRRRHQARYP